MSKESIGQGYIADMKRQHAHKQEASLYDLPHHVLLTGANNEGSIAEAIQQALGSELHKVSAPMHCDISTLNPLPDTDVLILCHGALSFNWIENQTWPDINTVISSNLTKSIELVKRFAAATMENRFRKKIISIGSMAYNSVLNGSSVYCASKAGLAHFMKCAAWELAPKGYDVFSVHPSNVENTPMEEKTIQGLMKYRGLDRKQAEDYWRANIIQPEMLQKEDIAKLVVNLLKPESRYLSGSNIELRGGQR